MSTFEMTASNRNVQEALESKREGWTRFGSLPCRKDHEAVRERRL